MMDDYRAQRQYYRAQRRAYRRQRRGYFGGFGGIIWLVIIIYIFSSHLFWVLLPLVLIGLPLFFWVIRPMIFGSVPNQQPYYQPPEQQPYYQPGYQQPEQQEQPYYQPPQQPVYQPYNQGYAAQQPVSQPHESYQETGQAPRYQEEPPAQQKTPQYEEPLTMYPQE